MNDQIEDILIRSLIEKSGLIKNKKFDVLKLAGDASTRKYYRVCNQDQSFVCCLDKPSLEGVCDFEKVGSQF